MSPAFTQNYRYMKNLSFLVLCFIFSTGFISCRYEKKDNTSIDKSNSMDLILDDFVDEEVYSPDSCGDEVH